MNIYPILGNMCESVFLQLLVKPYAINAVQ